MNLHDSILPFQARPRVGEEVLRQARGLHRSAPDPAQADEEGEQAEAEATHLAHTRRRTHRHPRRSGESQP